MDQPTRILMFDILSKGGWEGPLSFCQVLRGEDDYYQLVRSELKTFLYVCRRMNLCKQEVVFLHRRISTNAENVFLHLFHFLWQLYVSIVSSAEISIFSLFSEFCKQQIVAPLLYSRIICICTFLTQPLPSSVNSLSSPFTKAIASGSV